MVRRDGMAGHEGNFTCMVSKRHLTCFTTNTSKAEQNREVLVTLRKWGRLWNNAFLIIRFLKV